MEENGDQEFKIRQIKCLMSVKSKPGNATIFRTQNTEYRIWNKANRTTEFRLELFTLTYFLIIN